MKEKPRMKYLICGFAIVFVAALSFEACSTNPRRGGDSDVDSDSDSDSDTEDTDSDTENPYSDQTYAACYFDAFGDGDEDTVADLVASDEGAVISITHKGRIIRHGQDGEKVFEKEICSNAECSGRAIDDIGEGEFIVAGAFLGDAVFGAGETNEVTLCSLGEVSMFIAKYDSGGALLWAREATGEVPVSAVGVGTLSDGSFIVTGMIDPGEGGIPRDVVFGSGETNETVLTSIDSDTVGGDSSFLARYGEEGMLEWASTECVGKPGREVVAFPDGSFAVAGDFLAEATFGAGKPGAVFLEWFPIESTIDIWDDPVPISTYLARYNLDGSVVWVRRMSTTNPHGKENNLALLSDGSIAFAGTYYDILGFVDGGITKTLYPWTDEWEDGWDFAAAVFLARYTDAGDLVFANSTRCEGKFDFVSTNSNPVVLGQDRILVSGRSGGAVRYGSGEMSFAVMDSNKPFFAVYDYEGELTNLGAFGETLDPPSGESSEVIRLSESSSDEFFIGGAYSGEFEMQITEDSAITGSALTESDPFVSLACPELL